MAAIGQQLLQPESGWKRYDDTDSSFSYVGTWTKSSNATGSHNLTHTYVSDNTVSGQKINFFFKGSKLRIIILSNANMSNAIKITIDGVSETFSAYSSTNTSQMLVYEKLGLNNSTHFVELENVGTSTKKGFYFDAIDIDENGMIASKKEDLVLNKILLLSNDEAYSIEKGDYSNNVIPVMTSNTTPSGIARASQEIIGNEAWKAFDGDNNNTASRWATNNIPTGWISYEFNNSITISKYSIAPPIGNTQQAPKNWTFEASNDGVNWSVLDTQTNVSDWVDRKYKEYLIANDTSYKIYRINISANNGNTARLSVGELMMFETLPSSINQVPFISEQNLIKYGMDSPVQLDGVFSSKNYILQDTVSENEDGLWTTQLNRKPLSIRFD